MTNSCDESEQPGPAALDNAITLHNADRSRPKIVAEAGNGLPRRTRMKSFPQACCRCRTSHKRRRVNKLFRWAQDVQGFFWPSEEVNAKLEFVMSRASMTCTKPCAVSVYPARRRRTFWPSVASPTTLVRGLFRKRDRESHDGRSPVPPSRI